MQLNEIFHGIDLRLMTNAVKVYMRCYGLKKYTYQKKYAYKCKTIIQDSSNVSYYININLTFIILFIEQLTTV